MTPKRRLCLCFVALSFLPVAALSALAHPNQPPSAPISQPQFTPLYFLFYIVPLLMIWGIYLGLRSYRTQKSLEILTENIEASITEPATLHPVINHNRCLGCGSCVAACPEQEGHEVLGIINDKCHLINPSFCIGHGECAEACPQKAITLVFGSKTQGVDIPSTDKNQETNIDGVFIAGELGGLGLIHNAVNQGIKAVNAISVRPEIGSGNIYDVIIIGAGPAGLAATLAAKQKKIRSLTIDQNLEIGGTIAHFPKGKKIHTRPVRLPLVGTLDLTEVSKEELLAVWREIVRKYRLTIQYGQTMTSLQRTPEGIIVTTDKASYAAHTVILALGRRGTPRKLCVPGEEQSKVHYRLIDPHQFQGKQVMVVGGGDSAIEAATSIAAVPGTRVAISYRKNNFSRAKARNRKLLDQYCRAGKVCLYLNCQVTSIAEDTIQISTGSQKAQISNDAVIVCAGGLLPTPLLKASGISVEIKYGTP